MFSFSMHLSQNDYKTLRLAAMGIGPPFHHEFTRDPTSQDVTFTTTNVRKLCAQLEHLFDFGATSAYDVMDMHMTAETHGYYTIG